MKKILEQLLAFFGRRIVRKYKPIVVGITGSVGKSSTKEAVYAVLQGTQRVRHSDKNYNNEIGVPLTIIGAEPAGKNIGAWLGILLKAVRLLVTNDSNYPQVLILEYGADKPGDITYLTQLAPCTIGVVTRVSPAHVEFFGSVEKIAKEKRVIVSHLDKEGTAILNADDPLVRDMEKVTKAKVVTYGFGEDAMVRAIRLDQPSTDGVPGLRFKVQYQGSTVPMYIPGVFGEHQIYAVLAAAAVGVNFGLNLVAVGDALRSYVPPRGRMNLIPGIKDCLIVDDTYNSSPVAAQAAVRAIVSLPHEGAVVAIMGDMLELGDVTTEEHVSLGKTIAEVGCTDLVVVGQYRDLIAQGAREHGLTNILSYETSKEAAEAYPALVPGKAVVLVKGSQGSRMERVVKALMAEPEKAPELLVRQSEVWLRK